MDAYETIITVLTLLDELEPSIARISSKTRLKAYHSTLKALQLLFDDLVREDQKETALES